MRRLAEGGISLRAVAGQAIEMNASSHGLMLAFDHDDDALATFLRILDELGYDVQAVDHTVRSAAASDLAAGLEVIGQEWKEAQVAIDTLLVGTSTTGDVPVLVTPKID